MKNIYNLLVIGVVIISLVLIYLIFTGNSKLNGAIKDINNAKETLAVARDSLHNAQKQIGNALKRLEEAEVKLKEIGVERDLLALNEQKKYAKDWEDLQRYKGEITRKNEELDSLRKEVEKFEL